VVHVGGYVIFRIRKNCQKKMLVLLPFIVIFFIQRMFSPKGVNAKRHHFKFILVLREPESRNKRREHKTSYQSSVLELLFAAVFAADGKDEEMSAGE